MTATRFWGVNMGVSVASVGGGALRVEVVEVVEVVEGSENEKLKNLDGW